MVSDLLFFGAFSLLLTHEMDAVRCREWTIFPLLGRITQDVHGYALFTALHVPLYIVLLWAIFPYGGTLNQPVAIGFDLFCIVHVALHWLFRRHPRYEFNTRFSWTLILGAGLAGALDLAFRVSPTLA